MQRQAYDIIIVGGGLAGTLLALKLHRQRNPARVLLLEGGATLGGNHTWCFHGTDLSAPQLDWIAPLIAHQWSAQTVRFPSYERHLPTAYYSINSSRLHAVACAELGAIVRLNTPVCAVDADSVTLQDGERISANLLVDARGMSSNSSLVLGYQIFVGRELRFERPHGLTQPVIMDATVEQLGGYRFVYLLPFDEHRLLVEDTYYARSPSLEREALGARIEHYVLSKGWQVDAVEREEAGVLPITIDGDFEANWRGLRDGPLPLGMRAGLFHPTTGYSIGHALRLVELIAAQADKSREQLFGAIEAHARRVWREQRYFRRLNRMMFVAANDVERRMIFERFYRLPEGLIERFYAERLTVVDKLRILCGRPPVALHKALYALASRQINADSTADEIPNR